MNNPKQLLKDKLHELSTKLPKFPDGRINYTNAPEAPVMNAMVMEAGELLLLKRSDKVLTYKEKWNTVGGYIDEIKEAEEFVFQELREELGITREFIQTISAGDLVSTYDESIPITWHMFPFLVTLNARPDIELDWEHTEYRWINPDDLATYDTLPGLLDYYEQLRP